MAGSNTPSSPNSSSPASGSDWLKQAALQADTAVRNAADVLSFGLANRGEAALDATLGGSHSGTWGQRYNAALQQQAARDVYDHINRGTAQRLGELGGIGLAVADGNILGVEGSAALPIKAKGALGEALSVGKTILKGDRPVGFQVSRIMQNGRRTVVDHETANGISVESKFGPWAKLSRNQRYAQQQWGDLYRVDRWGPQHVGYITGGIGAGTGLLSAGLQNLPQNSSGQGGDQNPDQDQDQDYQGVDDQGGDEQDTIDQDQP